MIFRTQTLAGLSLAAVMVSAFPAHAYPVFGIGSKKKDANTGKKLTPGQSALIDKAVLREKVVIQTVKQRQPVVETYIQNMKPDPVMRQVPESDEHFLGRVDFGKVIGDEEYKEGPKAGEKQGKFGFLKGTGGFLGSLGGSLHLSSTRPASCPCC